MNSFYSWYVVSNSYIAEITYQQSDLTITLGVCANLVLPKDRVVQNSSLEALQKNIQCLMFKYYLTKET